MRTHGDDSDLRSSGYEIFVGMLSLLTLVNLALAFIIRSDRDLQTVLLVMDISISVIFLADFVVRFATASSKRRYFFRNYGWADLLSAIPFSEVRAFRLLRLIRVVQLFRDVGSRSIRANLRRLYAQNALLFTVLVGIVLVQFGSLQILAAERESPGGTIETASDALWYTLATISTVGYGDYVPTTNTGRLIGVLLIVVGVGMFAAFTGFVADRFLRPGTSRRRQAGTGESEVGHYTAGTPAAPATTAAPAPTASGRLEAIRAALARPEVTVQEIAHLAGVAEPPDTPDDRGP